MSACSTDADCAGGHGYCISSYCSCNSGFGDDSCSTRPDASCDSSFAAVSSSESSFSASASISYLYPNFTMVFNAGLETSHFEFPSLNDTLNVAPYAAQTVITFGDGSWTNCSFPNGAASGGIVWSQIAASAGNCNDKYEAIISWEDAKNKCGFADSDNNKIFTQTVYISRTYILPNLRPGNTVERTETSSHVLSVT